MIATQVQQLAAIAYGMRTGTHPSAQPPALHKEPVTLLLASISALAIFPMVMFTNLLRQDCPDTS